MKLLDLGGALFVTSEEIAYGWEVGHLSFMRAVAIPTAAEERNYLLYVKEMETTRGGGEALKQQRQAGQQTQQGERTEGETYEEPYLVRTGKIKTSTVGTERKETFALCSGKGRRVLSEGSTRLSNATAGASCDVPAYLQPTAFVAHQDLQMDVSWNFDKHGKYERYFVVSDPEIQNCKLVTFEGMHEMVSTPSVAFDLEDVVGYDTRFV